MPVGYFQARKLAALTRSHTVSSAAQATKREEDGHSDSAIIIAEESNPPPYSTPTPRPADLSEGLIRRSTVHERMYESDAPWGCVYHLLSEGHSETYNRDKPPPY